MNMEIPFMDHVRHSIMIDRNKDLIIDKLLNLTLEIICLLSGEDYIVVRKSGDPCAAEKSGRRVSDKSSVDQSLISGGSPPPPVTEENPSPRFPTPSRRLHRDTEKLPVKSEDAEVTAWDYSAEHGDAVAVAPEPRCSAGDSAAVHQRIFEPSFGGRHDSTDRIANDISAARSTESPPTKCQTPLCPQDCITLDCQTEPPGDEMLHQQCKEEQDTAIPDDVVTGGAHSTDHQEQCPNPISSEDFIEADNQMMSQGYQSGVGDVIFHQPCKEEDGPDYINSGPAVSALGAVAILQSSQAQEHFPNHSDPTARQKSRCTNNPFSCSICGIRFSSESTFVAHQRFHTEEKSYDCSYCGKSFNQRSRLLSHKRKHTGEKPFSCPVCGRCFAERSALVTHQRIHSGEKPFNCTECARSFVQRSSLVKHQRIHTGERPFVCSHCGRCFSQSSNLVRHQRILHQFL